MNPTMLSLDAYNERGKFGKGNMLRAKRNNLLCALKRMPKETLNNNTRVRIEHELLQLKQLAKHDHVIKYHDYFVDGGSSLYVEMEWASKGNLHALIMRHHANGRYFSEPTVWNLFLQIAKGLQHIHCTGELVHRDLQPSNVLIMENDMLKVGNLQLMEVSSCDLMQNSGGVYVAPEVLVHHATSTFASDVWSLGCLLYELICLVPPFRFDGKDSVAIARGKYPPIPEKPAYSLMLKSIVQAMLSVDAALRPDITEIVQSAELGCRENPKPPQQGSPYSSKTPNSPNTASPLHSPWIPSPPPFSSQLQGIRGRPPSILIPHGTTAVAALTTPADNAPATAPVVTSIISPYSTQAIKQTYVRSRSNLSHHHSAGGFTPVPPSPSLPRSLHHHQATDGISSPVPQSPRIARFVQVSDRHVVGSPGGVPTPPPYPPPAMAAIVSPKSAQLLNRRYDSPGGGLFGRHHRHSSTLAQVSEETGSNRSSDTEGNSPSSAPRNRNARERGAFQSLSVSTSRAAANGATAKAPEPQKCDFNPFSNNSANPFSKEALNPFATTGLITPKAEDVVDFFPPPPRNRLESPRSSHKFPLWVNARSASISPPVPASTAAVVPEPEAEETEYDDAAAYILGDVVGEGSFARVYRAVKCDSGISVAIKQFTLTDHYTAENAEQMEKEIDLLKELSHPNLVKYLGTRREPNKLNIVLEFCMIGSISQMLRSYTKFPENLIRVYTKQMNDGLIYLHEKNIVHRDIKGGNVLVSQEGSQSIVKLSDFGCSKRIGGGGAVGEQTMKQNGQLKGTVLWMAPEAARSMDCGLASDIWSMGATVIEMATGKAPWDEQKFAEEVPALLHIATTKKPPQFPPSFSAAGVAFLRACMEIDPTKRPSARQLKLNPFFDITAPPHGVRTAQVGVRPEIVGANAHRAAQKGRDILQDKETKQMKLAERLISEVIHTLCSLSFNANKEVWLSYFTANADVSLPCVTGPPQICGLPLFLRDSNSTVALATDRVEGHDAFMRRFGSSGVNHDVKVFTVKNVDKTKALIQASNRVAMWKWEMCGTWEDGINLCYITGSASCMFDTTGEKIKSLELQWEPSSILAKRL